MSRAQRKPGFLNLPEVLLGYRRPFPGNQLLTLGCYLHGRYFEFRSFAPSGLSSPVGETWR